MRKPAQMAAAILVVKTGRGFFPYNNGVSQRLPDPRVLLLLAELQAAYRGFTWESQLWREVGHRRSLYRTLVLFGLSTRTKDALLVEMCRSFFRRFPDEASLAARKSTVKNEAAHLVRAGQLPFVISMAEALVEGVPRRREDLLDIKGVGEKVAECVLAYGWGDDALPLDANCIRVLARVFGIATTDRGPGPLRKGLKWVYRMRREQFAELSMGMVDIHEILRLHGQLCCARTPDCARCPVSGCQSRRESRVAVLDVQAPPEIWDDWRELINEPFPA